MMRSLPLLLVTLAVPVTILACKKDKPVDDKGQAVELGEPIAAKVDAKPPVPAFEVAFAVAKGRDPMPLLPPLVGAISQSLAACPGFFTESKAAVTPFDFKVEKGKAKVAAFKEPTAGTTCFAAQLETKTLAAESFADVQARAELRFPTAVATASSSVK